MSETIRLPGVILVSRRTGEITMLWEDVPAEKVRPVVQGLVKIGREITAAREISDAKRASEEAAQ